MNQSNIAMRDHSAESALFVRRVVVSIVFVLALISVLFLNLYYLQVESFQVYKTRSNDNRINVLPVAPNRGLIYDRNGVLLAENRPIFSLEITIEKIDDLDKTVLELAELLGLDQDDIDNFYKQKKRQRRFKPVALVNRLTTEQAALFSVNQHKYHGVNIEAYLKRYYPHGDTLTHTLGYVGKINDKDVIRLDKEGKTATYAATRDIGKQGVERYYEEMLHGVPGYQEVEVNNRGKIIRVLKFVPPEPGKDIYLNIDLAMQRKAQKLLDGRRGSVVMIDAKDGGVLAMVSSPSYDPNLFVHGISSKNYNELLHSFSRPLINRATQGRYPPASTIKMQMALLGLNEGTITPQSKIWDPGSWQIPNTSKRFRDWKRWGHGWVDVYHAIEQSCDTFFYDLIYQVGIDKTSAFMKQFGFGDYTGIDIAEETTAVMPSRGWKRARFNQPWYQGDTISIGIGQGYWTATPIQLAQATANLARRGEVIVPRLLKSIRTGSGSFEVPPDHKAPIVLNNESYWQVALDGMYGVVNKKTGTARKAFADTEYKAAGKSGTAQVVNMKEDEVYDAEKLAEHHRDNAMFVAYAPFENPEVVTSVVVENAGGGSSHAAPVARAMFDAYFAGKKAADEAKLFNLPLVAPQPIENTNLLAPTEAGAQ
ncbi:penicillin-binding protein 2 [Motilimonas cestriensis]|uniref:Peptidoglycan D,D-transpeptidase MrdA n=1 Tax=Motilimonas cestriensis TaxID=2742685 RepID=A0ABS8W701_9GAMM|nr:penicillin-binding protein 2 [Motilimonas cestriensis]MCE2593584.1 penicillin-binding protein 2 [Motilimonas cestriensis]